MSAIALHPAQIVGHVAKKRSSLPFPVHSESIFREFIKMSFGSALILVLPCQCPQPREPTYGAFSKLLTELSSLESILSPGHIHHVAIFQRPLGSS